MNLSGFQRENVESLSSGHHLVNGHFGNVAGNVWIKLVLNLLGASRQENVSSVKLANQRA